MMSPDMQSVGVATAAVVLVGAAAFALLSKKKTPPKPYEALVYKGWKAATAKGARKTTGWLASKVDGHELFWQEHRPGSTPKAALVFGHGINDHCERFNHIFEELCAKHDIMVLSMDYRYHGNSTAGKGAEPPSGYFHTWDEVLDDWAHFIEFATGRANKAVQAAYPVGTGKPGEHIKLFVAGNSFGAMLTLHTLMRRKEALEAVEPDGVILVAPFIDVPRPLILKIQESLAPVLSALVPRVRLVESALPAVLSKDPEVVASYVADPLTIKDKIFIRPGYLMGLATYWLKDHQSEFSYPLLAIHGDEDKCTSFPHSAAFVEGCSSKDKTWAPIKGGAHLLLHGEEKEQVVQAIVSWIAQRA